MPKVLSQKEIDELVRILRDESHEVTDESHEVNKDFALDILIEKLNFFENKKKALLAIIESNYDPHIKNLQKAISTLKSNS